jgi:hypothetical protein
MAISPVLYDSATSRYYPSGSGFPTLTTYQHDQAVPAQDWAIAHDLGTVSVEVFTFDSLNRQVFGEPKWGDASANVLTVRFSVPISGRAYVRPLA